MKRKANQLAVLIISVCLLLPGSAVYAGGKSGGTYHFSRNKSAVKQLNDLFTTIDIMDATIKDLTKEMEAGNVTSVQLTQMYIDRINAYDSRLKLNSIISICPDAIAQAKKLDKERAKGKVRGPLHGIPVIVKDNIDVKGSATSGGSLALAHMVVSRDAYAVKKLKAAGAVIIAKANLSEFASSAIDSKSLLGGVVHNAYDTSRVPAGSSGGTGVAITSNFAAAGLGTDTGGSIRNPSSYCNLYGMRPSKGLTSVSGVIPLAASRDTVGPMTRTAEDMAQILEVIAGTDANDDFTQEADADALLGSGYMRSLSSKGLKGKRIGYLKSSFEFSASDENETTYKIPEDRIDAMVKRTRADLRKAGAEFVDMSSYINDDDVYSMYEVSDEYTAEYDLNKYLYEKGDEAPYKTLKALYKSGSVGIYHTNLPVSEDQLEFMADSFEETVDPYDTEINGYMRLMSWPKVLEYRQEITKLMEEHNIDAIMYIATFGVAPTAKNLLEELDINNAGWLYGFTFGPALGMPEVVIPMGFSDADDSVSAELPLGMRLVGKFGDEKTLMEMAYAYEKQAGASIRRMPANSPALKDAKLEAYLESLMDAVYSINYSRYKRKPTGKIQLMKQAYAKAAKVDTSDPYATYKAAKKLAKSYDSVIKALKKSGLKKR